MVNSALFNDDCLALMDELIRRNIRIDTIITSPPYNMNLRIMDGNFIGVELDKKYFEIAKERINAKQ